MERRSILPTRGEGEKGEKDNLLRKLFTEKAAESQAPINDGREEEPGGRFAPVSKRGKGREEREEKMMMSSQYDWGAATFHLVRKERDERARELSRLLERQGREKPAFHRSTREGEKRTKAMKGNVFPRPRTDRIY